MTGLIERIESAEGPSRELDAEIAIATLVLPEGMTAKRSDLSSKAAVIVDDRNRICGTVDAPNYTASIDAALTLVPDGMAGVISIDCGYARLERENGEHWSGDAATPALAMCVAALRARGEPA